MRASTSPEWICPQASVFPGVAQRGEAASKWLLAGEVTPHPAAHGRHPLPSERAV